MIFVDAGNDRVGIGTSAPDSKLHVVGNYNYFDTLDDTTANNIYFRDNSKNLRGQLEFAVAGKESQLVTRTNSHLRLGTNNAGYIHIDRDGLVGIGGTGQPGSVLTSHGDTSISGELKTSGNLVVYRDNGMLATDTVFEVEPNNNRIRLRDHTYVSGNLYVSGSVVTADGTAQIMFLA